MSMRKIELPSYAVLTTKKEAEEFIELCYYLGVRFHEQTSAVEKVAYLIDTKGKVHLTLEPEEEGSEVKWLFIVEKSNLSKKYEKLNLRSLRAMFFSDFSEYLSKLAKKMEADYEQ